MELFVSPRWSKSAAVFVVGCPHEHRWSGIRSVARSVMRQTHCQLRSRSDLRPPQACGPFDPGASSHTPLGYLHDTGNEQEPKATVSRPSRKADSARTVALVLAVLAYRRRLRRRDRWSRPRLLAYQDQALARLRTHTYRRSPFYQDFHAGLTDAPLSALPVLTKQRLMDNFDRLATRPDVHLADVERYLAQLRGNELFDNRYYVSATAGTTGRRGIFLWDFQSGYRSSVPITGRSTGPARLLASGSGSRPRLSAQPTLATSRSASAPRSIAAGCRRCGSTRAMRLAASSPGSTAGGRKC
jgi:hypothetical protein